jgi:polyhydroxybutyrate depolymerase
MSAKADQAGFIVVYPDAIGNPRTWNAGLLSGQNEAWDVEFLRALLDELSRTLKVDPRRVYVVGHGSGAMMAYWLAGALSQRIAAVGVVSGSVGVRRWNGEVAMIPKPAQPVAVVAFHGKHDYVVPYMGGSGRHSSRRFLSVAEAVQFWREQGGCSAEPVKEALVKPRLSELMPAEAGTPTAGTQRSSSASDLKNALVIRETWGGCRNAAEIVLYILQDGNSKWPGGKSLRRYGNEPSQRLSATDHIWDFFARHSKP